MEQKAMEDRSGKRHRKRVFKIRKKRFTLYICDADGTRTAIGGYRMDRWLYRRLFDEYNAKLNEIVQVLRNLCPLPGDKYLLPIPREEAVTFHNNYNDVRAKANELYLLCRTP